MGFEGQLLHCLLIVYHRSRKFNVRESNSHLLVMESSSEAEIEVTPFGAPYTAIRVSDIMTNL